jgi:hypothetical protein
LRDDERNKFLFGKIRQTGRLVFHEQHVT